MKKFLLLSLAAVAVLSFSSCSEDSMLDYTQKYDDSSHVSESDIKGTWKSTFSSADTNSSYTVNDATYYTDNSSVLSLTLNNDGTAEYIITETYKSGTIFSSTSTSTVVTGVSSNYSFDYTDQCVYMIVDTIKRVETSALGVQTVSNYTNSQVTISIKKINNLLEVDLGSTTYFCEK